MSAVKKIYFIPPGPNMLQGKLFLSGSAWGGSFRKFFEDRGIELKTIDQWDGNRPSEDEALVVWNHPDDYWFARLLYDLRQKLTGKRKFPVSHAELKRVLETFSKKVLFQWEPPIVTPYSYKHMENLRSLYGKIFSTVKFTDGGIGHFVAPYDFDDYARPHFEEYFDVPKTKFLTLINSNALIHGYRKQELYTERLRAIRYFSRRQDFDLYGTKWNKLPRFPNWHYAKYVRKCWRGMIPGPKYPVLAEYRFTILFENSVFPGYVDVKFLDCFVCGVVPVYLGAPDIGDYVPAGCFIDMRKFGSYAELERHLRSLSAAEVQRYRQAAREFLHSERFRRLFSFKVFAEKVFLSVTE